MMSLHIHSDSFYVKQKTACFESKDRLFAVINEEDESFCFFQQNPLRKEVTEELWSCLMIKDILDFDESGILNEILTPIASISVSVLVISGMKTDYIFVKKERLNIVKKILIEKGHSIYG